MNWILKTLLSVVLWSVVCGQLCAQTNVIYGYVVDSRLQVQKRVKVTMTRLYPTRATEGLFDVQDDPISTLTATNGYYAVTNLLWGKYERVVDGLRGTPFIFYVGTNTTGTVPITSLTTNQNALPINTGTNIYTQAQVDALVAAVNAAVAALDAAKIDRTGGYGTNVTVTNLVFDTLVEKRGAFRVFWDPTDSRHFMRFYDEWGTWEFGDGLKFFPEVYLTNEAAGSLSNATIYLDVDGSISAREIRLRSQWDAPLLGGFDTSGRVRPQSIASTNDAVGPTNYVASFSNGVVQWKELPAVDSIYAQTVTDNAASSNAILSVNHPIPVGMIYWDNFERTNSLGTLGMAPSWSTYANTNFSYFNHPGFSVGTSYVSNGYMATLGTSYPTFDAGKKPTHVGVRMKYKWTGLPGGNSYTSLVFISSPSSNSIESGFHFSIIPPVECNATFWFNGGESNLVPAHFIPPGWVAPDAGQEFTFQYWIWNSTNITFDFGGAYFTTNDARIAAFGGRYMTLEQYHTSTVPYYELQVLDAWAGDNPMPPIPVTASSSATTFVYTNEGPTVVTNANGTVSANTNIFASDSSVVSAKTSATNYTDSLYDYSVNLGGLTQFTDKHNNRQLRTVMVIGDSIGYPSGVSLSGAYFLRSIARDGEAGAGLMNRANILLRGGGENSVWEWDTISYGSSYTISNAGYYVWSNSPSGFLCNRVGAYWLTTNAENAELYLQVSSNAGSSYITMATLNASNSTPVVRGTNINIALTNYLVRLVATNAPIKVFGVETINTNNPSIVSYQMDAPGEAVTAIPVNNVSNLIAVINPDLLWIQFRDASDTQGANLSTLTNNQSVYRSLSIAVGGRMLVSSPWFKSGVDSATNQSTMDEVKVDSWGAQTYGWTFFDSAYHAKNPTNQINQGWMADTTHFNTTGGSELSRVLQTAIGLSFSSTNTSAVSVGSYYPLTTNPSNYVAGLASNNVTLLGERAAASVSGTAIGADATANSAGAAVGRQSVASTEGAAIGYLADGNTQGAAIGRSAYAFNFGTAVGAYSDGRITGVGLGTSATGTNSGVAVGASSYANGAGNVAIGKLAKVTATAASKTVQLGTGTNSTDGTLQFNDYTVMTSSGTVPNAALPNVQSVYYQSGLLGINSTTTNLIAASSPMTIPGVYRVRGGLHSFKFGMTSAAYTNFFFFSATNIPLVLKQNYSLQTAPSGSTFDTPPPIFHPVYFTNTGTTNIIGLFGFASLAPSSGTNAVDNGWLEVDFLHP